ncbi:MAG TPA: carboxypeptidase regulatory-like domain-containing protein [Candidatus Binatia bacterium]|nr:carboxypeptidase regulatory-like domain-containing protein [Candidatus Binatia bacterium]
MRDASANIRLPESGSPLLLSVLALALVLSAIHSQAGTIAGVVHAQGKEAPAQDAAGGKYDSRKYKFAERINYAELRDFVVYVDGVTTEKPTLPPVKIITQKGVTFIPRVMPVMVGTIIEWPNQDEIFHNVFSISEAKQFDLDLYKSPEIKRVPFDKPGRIDVFCSIHTTMSCVILVLENPWFALSDARGHYSITNVPPGTYKLKAWHERLPALTKEVVVPADGELNVDFTLGILNLPKY